MNSSDDLSRYLGNLTADSVPRLFREDTSRKSRQDSSNSPSSLQHELSSK